MNGIDKIIARMEADTQAECADIAAQAAAEAEAILARYRAEADKLLREGEARCKVLEHEQVERLEGGSRLARETGGGVVLQRGRMEINCGFAELLRRARQEDSSAVAAVLFD